MPIVDKIWDKALQIFERELLSRIRNRAAVTAWFQALRTCEDGERLAVCLAIDLAYEAYTDNAVALLVELLESIDLSATDGREEFGAKLERSLHREDLYCASRFIQGPDGTEYAHVLRLEKFITCAGSVFGFVDSAEDKNRIRKRFYTPAPLSVGSLDRWWTAEVGIVWVTPVQALIAAMDSTSANQRGSKIKDMLGLIKPAYLGAHHNLEYVALKYPPEFTRPCHQPTTLDAWWRDPGQFYLSFSRLDCWGRTQSCSGKLAPCLERVHRVFEFEDFGSAYSLLYIGTVDSFIEDPDRLLEEAANRLASVP